MSWQQGSTLLEFGSAGKALCHVARGCLEFFFLHIDNNTIAYLR